MTNIRKAVIYSSISRYVIKVLSLISVVVVARMLTPSEIGTFAIASAIVMIMGEFRLLGAGSYLVREKEISLAKVRAALGLTILISWGLGIAIFFSAERIAIFYELPPVASIFKILAISFFIAPYISIPSAILARSFAFKSIFYIKVTGAIFGLISSISLIYLGYSFYSLAWGYTIGVIASFIMVIFFWPDQTPIIPAVNGMKKVAAFGIYTSVSNLFRKATMTVADMVIGKMGTTAEVGMYSRGLGFVDFISQSLIQGIAPVALPYLSDTRRKCGDVNAAYIKVSVLIGGLVWPVLAVSSLVSLPAIRLFFGDQWDAAAPLASFLSIWVMIRTIHWFSNTLLTTIEKERILMLRDSGIFILYLFGVIFAFPFGLSAIALSFICTSIVELVITSIILSRTSKLNVLQFYRSWLPTVAVTAICYLATFLIGMQVDYNGENYWYSILLLLIILPIVWLVGLKVCRHILYLEIIGLFHKFSDDKFGNVR
jgi:O-antigen/teichoic acid export membrane protein